MEKARRRELARDYKEQRSRPGVFGLKCAATGQAWVAGSRAIDTAHNSVTFSLHHGSHRNRELQAAWNAHGDAGVVYVVLDALDDTEMTSVGRDTWLKSRVAHWIAELNAKLAT